CQPAWSGPNRPSGQNTLPTTSGRRRFFRRAAHQANPSHSLWSPSCVSPGLHPQAYRPRPPFARCGKIAIPHEGICLVFTRSQLCGWNIGWLENLNRENDMRIAYITLDDVNRFMLRRWAAQNRLRVECPSANELYTEVRGVDAVVVDLDFLPAELREIWLS